jgi:hypothetical protein
MGALPATRRDPRPTVREQLVKVIDRLALQHRGTGSTLPSSGVPDSVGRIFVAGVCIDLDGAGRVVVDIAEGVAVDWPLAMLVMRDVHRDAGRVMGFNALEPVDTDRGPRR